MEYRQLPHGSEQERFSVLGLGMGGIQNAPEGEIEQVVRTAVDHGINFFDLCGGGSRVYAPFGRAVAGQRERVFFQLHLGAVYNEKGEYGWSRDLVRIKKTFEWELETLGTDYADFGFLHCVDEDEDYDKLVSAGILDYAKELKAAGKIRHIGFSSHTPSVAHRILDTGVADMMMFSVNPAYDLEQGDEYGIGSTAERAKLLRRCEAEGVGVSVMNGPRGDFYKNMFAKCPAGRPGTADEVANVAELLMSDRGAFITGATILIDGGATASYYSGPLKPQA